MLNKNTIKENGIQLITNDIDNAKLFPPVSNCEEKSEIKALNQKDEAELERFKNDTNLKKKLTYFVVWFTSIWSLGIIIILALFGCGRMYFSDPVMIALITETLVTVLGLPLVVTSHFFPKQ